MTLVPRLLPHLNQGITGHEPLAELVIDAGRRGPGRRPTLGGKLVQDGRVHGIRLRPARQRLALGIDDFGIDDRNVKAGVVQRDRQGDPGARWALPVASMTMRVAGAATRVAASCVRNAVEPSPVWAKVTG